MANRRFREPTLALGRDLRWRKVNVPFGASGTSLEVVELVRR